MLSLMTDPWLPIIDQHNQTRRIRLVDILEESIINLAWPREDFQGACLQLLIGLLQLTVPPVNRAAWEQVWQHGIDPQSFATQLARLEPVFRFGKEKPSFMQDFETLNAETVPIATLLMESPGADQQRLNIHPFFRHDKVLKICPVCAMMSLFTLQINASFGGRGHRTGLRGGGPLTTLVFPLDLQTPLWRKLWLNILCDGNPAPFRIDEARFPWCGPTRTSELPGAVTTPEMVDKHHVYWSMPRRIEMDYRTPLSGQCDLCGDSSGQLITHCRTKNHGISYSGWQHPLTPYRLDHRNPENPKIPLKGQPGGLLYKDWLGLILDEQDKNTCDFPAAVVKQALQFTPAGVRTGLYCFAYDMDKNKARCWYQHILPLPCLAENQLTPFLNALKQALLAAKEGLQILQKALKTAGHSHSGISHSFWYDTEPQFIRLMETLQTACQHSPLQLTALADWHQFLRWQITKRFDSEVFNQPNLRCEEQHFRARELLVHSLNNSPSLQKLTCTEPHHDHT